ncbi:unnamed protein product [Diatraea saccharalis]|uniref:RRM domain-containing protein n=1 Tax=Diatraea saccharalis TaxID=40085 RepID=A0A9P0G232_9NEOP|nr:unnamed protein product [Diatraea saccharalis]
MSHTRSRSRSRSPLSTRSRSPRAQIESYEIPDSPPNNTEQRNDNDTKEDFRRLLVKNAPYNWKWETFREFINLNSQSPVVKAQLPHVSTSKNGEFLLRFTSSLPCLICYKELQGAKADGRKLHVTPITDKQNEDKKSEINKRPKKETKITTLKKVITTATFSSDQNANETYGLSMNFLTCLGIKPPLINKVFVGNLVNNIDKEKLREVFGFAGNVTNVYIFRSRSGTKKSAKIEFDHPVEAVQAISMFHRQELYGRSMVVQMDQQPHTQSLPEGLATIGPGLGPNGEPLNGIRNLVEIQPLKQLLTQELNELKTAKSNELAQVQANLINANSTSLLGNPLHNIMTPLNINTMNMNPLNPAASMIGMNVPLNQPVGGQSNVQSWQGLLQQNMGNDLATTLAALQAHNVSNKSGFSQTLSSGQNNRNSQTSSANNDSYQMDDRRDRKSLEDNKDRNLMTSSDMLVFNNLPPSVTVQALNNKMREIGEVVFAEITGHGRAIVRFRHNEDADRCVKIFDRSKVDGQTIEVKFF